MTNGPTSDGTVGPVAAGEAERFLLAHSPLANADLLGYIASGTPGGALLGLHGPAGLLAVMGVRTAPNAALDHVVWLESGRNAASLALLQAAPPGRLYVKIHDDMVADRLEQALGLVAGQRRSLVYFGVTCHSFAAEAPREGRMLLRQDLELFPTPQPPAASALGAAQAGTEVWGIERSGQIVCSAIGASIARTPAGDIAAIAALHTDEAWRCRGLASRLVSAMTENLLRRHRHVLYWATKANAASQRVATKAGYARTHQLREYLIDSRQRAQGPAPLAATPGEVARRQS